MNHGALFDAALEAVGPVSRNSVHPRVTAMATPQSRMPRAGHGIPQIIQTFHHIYIVLNTR